MREKESVRITTLKGATVSINHGIRNIPKRLLFSRVEIDITLEDYIMNELVKVVDRDLRQMFEKDYILGGSDAPEN